MNRLLLTNAFPRSDADAAKGSRFVTLQNSAAAALGVPNCSLNTLAREVLRKKGIAVADAVGARHLLKRTISREVGGDASSIASRISESLNVILRTGIDPDEFVKHATPRAAFIGRIAKAYKKALRASRRIDAAELLSVAARLNPERQCLTIYGYHRARKEEILFIDAIAGEGSRYYLPIADSSIFAVNRRWQRYLEANGWRTEDNGRGPETPGEKLAARFVGAGSPAGVVAAEYPHLEAEVRGVLSEAKRLVLAGTDIRRIAVVCRKHDLYSPVIDAVAAEYRLPVEIRREVRLADTAFGGFVRLFLDAAGQDLRYESTARFAMHPFGPGLEKGVWTKARKAHTAGREAWTELQPELGKIEWPESQPLSAWIAGVRTVFEAFDVRAKAAVRPREILAYERFFKALYIVSEIERERQLSPDEFSAVAAEILADESVRFRPSSGGVAVLEPKSMLGADLDHVFVLGLAEGIFPAPINEDAALDLFERKALAAKGVEFAEAAELARWEDLSFYFTLLAGRGQVYLSFPSTIEGRESVESGYFSRLGIKAARADGVSASSVVEQRTLWLRGESPPTPDDVIGPARLQYAVEAIRESSAPYDNYDGVTGEPIDPASIRWSVSQLTTIGQCRFRWFAGKKLHLKIAEEIDIGMDYTKRGSFYHSVLEKAVRKALGDDDIRAGTLSRLEEAFAEAENDPEVERPVLSNWALQRSEHIKALRKAVEAADFIKPGSRVIELEKWFDAEWKGMKISGRIDRIDDTPEGPVAIDYKTSSSVPKGAKDDLGRLSVDLQIPIYSNVALKSLYPGKERGSSAYYSLTKGKILRKEKDDDIERAEGFLDRLKADLARGDLAVDPDVELKACAYCDIDPVCRKGERLNRKNSR